jgi:agmatinase
MMDAMVVPERPFLGCPVVSDIARLDTDVLVLGIPHAVSYPGDEDEQHGLATAPTAVRDASQQFAEDLAHHDFNLGHAFLREGGPRLVDAGACRSSSARVSRTPTTLPTTQIVGQDVMPLVIGGDDSIPPIVARALAAHATFDVVTIDAHLDTS